MDDETREEFRQMAALTLMATITGALVQRDALRENETHKQLEAAATLAVSAAEFLMDRLEK